MGLRSKLINALLGADRKITPASSKHDLLDFINLLRPSNTGVELIRIGGEGDGGYLVPNDLEGIKYCFSPGVSEIATFEENLADKYAIRSYLADASIEKPPIKNDFFQFEKKFLGTQNSGQFMRLESWLEDKDGQIGQSDLILQMDIEGAEYDVLIDTSAETLRRFRIMVVEFHDLTLISDKSALKLLRPLFEKIANDFVVAHLHPNNYKKPALVQGVEVPRALEVTFLRRDRLRSGHSQKTSFPHILDRRNLPDFPDVSLPKDWW